MPDQSTYVVRSEPDPDREYHCDALAACFPGATEVDFVAGERFDPADADAVVLSGSTAGVYERDERPWVPEQEELVRELRDRAVPTLGVCFGHQIANAALGGTVERIGLTTGLVEADLDDVALFDGVDPVVPVVHGDAVTKHGTGMEPIASAEHASIFGTRHRDAPLWTVQFHPEITSRIRHRLTDAFDWREGHHSFEDVSAMQVFQNFRALASGRPVPPAPKPRPD